MKLLIEKGSPGRKAVALPEAGVPPEQDAIPQRYLREELKLPELSELEVVRHFVELSRRNFGIDNGFYPLGSCTMKYNPRVNEAAARLPGFAKTHPYLPGQLVQGNLQLLHELSQYLCELMGMDAFTLQPAAGAHGELTSVMMTHAYFEDKGEPQRKKIIIPDSAHGTNPASCSMCRLDTAQVKSDSRGCVDIKALKEMLDDKVAALMLTNPNTLGLFEENILEIADLLHDNGSLFYGDGANANALVGTARPGDTGFDVIQLNLHKTFSTPHGGGGPGAGPVGVKKMLEPYLPRPVIEKKGDGTYYLNYNRPKSIGKVRSFYGNFGVLVRTYTYIRALGPQGIKRVSENAVLNANYLMAKLKKHFHLPYDRICKHEFVLSDRGMPNGVTTNDIAKRLLDFGVHAPTIYFPLIVHGAIMIEPTETESMRTLDEFADIMVRIKKEAETNPEIVKTAPHTLPVKRLDAVRAARQPDLRWRV